MVTQQNGEVDGQEISDQIEFLIAGTIIVWPIKSKRHSLYFAIVCTACIHFRSPHGDGCIHESK
jgi:hypothetical protein